MVGWYHFWGMLIVIFSKIYTPRVGKYDSIAVVVALAHFFNHNYMYS